MLAASSAIAKFYPCNDNYNKNGPHDGSLAHLYSHPLPPLLGEHRVYIRDGRILGLGRYDDADTSDDDAAPDMAGIADMVAAVGPSAPAGYALDVAVCDGRTILVEATDGWAIGYYRGTCSAADYAAMLAARWLEIMTGVNSTGVQV